MGFWIDNRSPIDLDYQLMTASQEFCIELFHLFEDALQQEQTGISAEKLLRFP
jgi:hypothetical protein